MGTFAAEALGRIGDRRAVEPLIAHIRDSDQRVRENVLRALGQIGDPRAIKPLAGELKEAIYRQHAAAALVQIGSPALEVLTAGLQDGDAAVRKTCCEALAQIGDRLVENALCGLLLDRELSVRRSAADALEMLGWQPGKDEISTRFWIAKEDWKRCAEIGAPAVGPLVASLHDSYGSGPVEAARVLIEIGAPAVEALVAALQDRDGRVRVAAARSLGEIGDSRVVEPLIIFFNGLGRSQDERVATAYALGKISDARAVEPLLQALQARDDRVREAAAHNLGMLGDLRSVAPLIAALQHAEGLTRGEAAKALGRLGDPQAVEPLIDLLKDNVGYARWAAAEALEPYADPRATEPLLGLLKDSSGGIRKAAARSLVRIYQSGSLDESMKKRILEQRELITEAHTDEFKSTGQSSDCTSYHVDSGIGVDFPV